jgi:hypothetical protein
MRRRRPDVARPDDRNLIPSNHSYTSLMNMDLNSI